MSTLLADSVSASNTLENPEIKKPTDKKSFHQNFLIRHPGHLDSEGTLHIKTRIAQRHFLPLLTFAKQIKVIYRAARSDDPYADAYLIQVEQMLDKTQQSIQESITFYQQCLSSYPDLFLSLADTEKPLRLPVRFSTPYGYIAARLLVDFDRLSRHIVSLYQWGLLAEMPLGTLLHQLSRPLNRLWGTTKNWKPSGLTRSMLLESIAQNTETTSSTQKLDPRILNKELRAKYAPRILMAKQTSSATKSKETL